MQDGGGGQHTTKKYTPIPRFFSNIRLQADLRGAIKTEKSINFQKHRPRKHKTMKRSKIDRLQKVIMQYILKGQFIQQKSQNFR